MKRSLVLVLLSTVCCALFIGGCCSCPQGRANGARGKMEQGNNKEERNGPQGNRQGPPPNMNGDSFPR